MKILLVEDDTLIATTLAEVLTQQHYIIDWVEDGETAWMMLINYEYDLILLDVMIPKLDGMELCRKLRSSGYEMPIILLSALHENRDRIEGLEAGATDYIIKPFKLPDLVRRIQSILLPSSSPSPYSDVFTWEKLKFNVHTGEVMYGDIILHLTPKEYNLLELFLRNPRRIFSRSVILDRIWPMGDYPGEEAVTTHIKGLRQKLKSAGMTLELIETVYGLGYRLKNDPNQENTQEETGEDFGLVSKLRNPHLSRPIFAQKPASFWSVTWDKYKENLIEKIAIFERISYLTKNQNHDPILWKKGELAVHQLSGSLGSFGLIEISKMAREIERCLKHSRPWNKEEIIGLEEFIKTLKNLLVQPSSLRINPHAVLEKTLKFSPPETPPTLLIIDDNIIFSELLKGEAINWGFHVEIITNLNAARQEIKNHLPDVILLDINFSEGQEDGLTLLRELKQKNLNIPVLVVSNNEQLSNRLEIARLGASAFLQKDINPTEILTIITENLRKIHPIEAKILIVDDDPSQLSALQIFLQPWGFQITTLDNPELFWEVLEATTPDLLILDIEMPNFNGIDLCQVVRNDARWNNLPIIFLSVHTHPEIVHKVFCVGGDDYVNKPIIGPELIARILNRLERNQLRQKLQKNK